jgi:hypothetical protein
MEKNCIFSQVENACIRAVCAGQMWFWVWAIFSGLRGQFKSYEMCADVDTTYRKESVYAAEQDM